MHTVTLSTAVPPPADQKSFLGLVWKSMNEAQKHKSRIYRTYVDVSLEDKRFVLMTTSKDLHLKLGSFEWSFNYNLAKFLEEEFAFRRCSQLLLCFEDAKRNSEEGLLVSMTTERGSIVFTLALAH